MVQVFVYRDDAETSHVATVEIQDLGTVVDEGTTIP